MSILSSLQSYLETYPGMELRPMSEVLTDGVSKPGDRALLPTGNGKISRDILGGTTYQNDYLFYAKEPALEELDRRENYDFLEGFMGWLENQGAVESLPVLPTPYRAEGLEVSNAMLFDVDQDGAGTYQVQLQMTMRKD